MELAPPDLDHLGSYTDALRRGWSPNTTRPEAATEELRRANDDPEGFLAGLVDLAGAGPPVTLPDGSTASRLPSVRWWMWDGAFAGSINLRWQHGTTELPPHCLGHVGYTVVPWRRRRGYATAALRELLPHAARLGLAHLDLTTDPDNAASQKVILANGGVLVRAFDKPAAYGGGQANLYRIVIAS